MQVRGGRMLGTAVEVRDPPGRRAARGRLDHGGLRRPGMATPPVPNGEGRAATGMSRSASREEAAPGAG